MRNLFNSAFFSHVDSLNGPFPATSHRYHHKPKRLPNQPCGSSSSFPLLFHPSTKGSQIVMDMSQRTVKRQASFCNAITFSNRPIAVYEQVRLKVSKIHNVHPSGMLDIIKFSFPPCFGNLICKQRKKGQMKNPSVLHIQNQWITI